MLGPEAIERYRKMSPGERLKETFEMMDLAWDFLLSLPEEERRRRLDLVARQHEEGNRLLLEGLGRTRG